MKLFNFIKFQLFFVLLLIFTSFCARTIYAQSPEKPIFYCIGADCSTFTESDTAKAQAERMTQNNASKDKPCIEKSKEGRSLFSIMLELIGLISRPSEELVPCPSSATPDQPGTQPAGQQTQAIQFIDHTVEQVAGHDMSIKVGKPGGAQAGDILVAMIGSDYAHVKKAPDGWNLIRQDVKNEGHEDDLAMQSYYKIVTNNEEGSYKWKLTTKRKDTPSKKQPLIAVDLYAFRGVDQSNPIVTHGIHGETNDPQAIECPSVQGVAGGMLICAYIGDDPGPITAPGSMHQTSNFEIGGGDTYAIAYEKLSSNGDTGSRVASWNNSEQPKKDKKDKKKKKKKDKDKQVELKNGSDFGQAVVLRPAK